MKIVKIHARELHMKLIAPFETSFGVTQLRRILLVELITDRATGWGELTAAEAPYYNSETTDTAWLVLRNYLAPALVGMEFEDPDELSEKMRFVRGHEMAKATLETAAWDAAAKAKNVSLSTLLGGQRREIISGVSLSIYADTEKLLQKIAQELAAGYQRIKLKIKPGKDVEVVKTVRAHYPDIHLTVDANSAYTLADLPLLKKLDEFNLDYIEQPLQWNEIYQHAQLQKALETDLCLDECVHNLRDVEAAIHLGACRVINIKLGRVSGHSESRRIQAYCQSEGIAVWSGGMLEAGIGRAHNIAMSSQAGFVYPGDVSASARYWTRDIVHPEITATASGTISVPTAPGIGYEIDRATIDEFTVAEQVWEL